MRYTPGPGYTSVCAFSYTATVENLTHPSVTDLVKPDLLGYCALPDAWNFDLPGPWSIFIFH